MRGKGILKGLGTTGKWFFKKKTTQLYPDVKPVLPPRSRGKFKLKKEDCIACGLCVNACPNEVIKMESEKDEETKKRRLTGYKMNLERCLYCGFCTEACPTKALKPIHSYENAVYHQNEINQDFFNNNEEYKSQN